MFEVRPRYGAIEAARDIVEPWIEIEGTEWAESMSGLHHAAHTSYGFSDEDCALFAGKLLDNLVGGADFFHEYYEDELPLAQKSSREARDYWLNGGNLGDWHTTIEDAKSVIEQLPGWVFGE